MGNGINIREAHFPGRAPLEAYGNGGFRFADMSHRGSILCLPSGIYGWQPASAALSSADLAQALAEANKIDILLIGTGAKMQPLPAETRAALRARGLAFEVMTTGAAARSFNILLSEDRAAAAALIAVD